MKISTLNVPIKHRINISHDEQRLEALSKAMDSFIAEISQELREKYVLSHFDMLRKLSPALKELSMCGEIIILGFEDGIKYLDALDMDKQEITRNLIVLCMSERGE